MPAGIKRQNALFQLISQNQESFIGLLNEPDEAGEEGTEGGVAGGGNVQAAPGGGIQIQVTPDEKAQIDKVWNLKLWQCFLSSLMFLGVIHLVLTQNLPKN